MSCWIRGQVRQSASRWADHLLRSDAASTRGQAKPNLDWRAADRASPQEGGRAVGRLGLTRADSWTFGRSVFRGAYREPIPDQGEHQTEHRAERKGQGHQGDGG